MPAGRPSSWNQELEDEILTRLSHGEPLTKICLDVHIPAESTIYRWEDHVEGFSDKVTRARERSADHFSHQILEIADEECTMTVDIVQADGGSVSKICTDPAGVQRNRLRVDTRVKLMQMLKRKTYGEHIQQDHKVTGEIQFVAQSILEEK